MRQALYRKYRSNSLNDVVGQDSIIKTLLNSIKESKISHAYLFVGPRGVGKTSVARILAHKINNLDYKTEDHHVDIIEIDGASNRGIDEIRDLREKSSIAPTNSKYKVYIIDEVHMLTMQAFNALLKLLEEPPSHVVFILATTEIQKVPETIISRTQKFTFRPIDDLSIIERLKVISKKENISISDDALKLIAQISDGGLRDAISILDQLSSMSMKIERDNVSELIGLPPDNEVNKIVEGVLTHSLGVNQLFTIIDELNDQGVDIKVLTASIIDQLKFRLLSEPIYSNNKEIIDLMKTLLEVNEKSNFKDYLKVVLAGYILNTSQNTQSSNDNLIPIKKTPPPTIEVKVPKKNSVISSDVSSLKSIWENVLSSLKETHSTLYSTLMMSKVNFIDEKTIEVVFKYKFYANQLKNQKNFKIISDILSEIGTSNISIITSFDKNLVVKNSENSENDIIDDTSEVVNQKTVFEVFEGAEIFNEDSGII